MDKPIVSIVANFYNSAKFIPKLMESIQKQTFTAWQLVAVNDCSPGRDLEILERYAATDPRIVIVDNKVNQGICQAKWIGIAHAEGQYITFIDGDDWLEPRALEVMVQAAMAKDLDMVVINNYRDFRFFRRECRSSADYGRVIERDEWFDRYFVNFFGLFRYGVTYWAKLYRTDMVRNCGFKIPETVIKEDLYFSTHIFQHVNRMMFVDYAGYHWRFGGLSSVGSNPVWGRRASIERNHQFFDTRLELIAKYDYQKALKWLLIELRNHLLECFYDEARYDFDDRRAADSVAFLRRMMAFHGYADIMSYPDYKAGNHAQLDRLLVSGDVRGVYDYCRRYRRQNMMRDRAKKILKFLIR